MPKEAEKIAIPDLIIIDIDRMEIINIEGERAVNVLVGIEQLKTFSNMEKVYLEHYYPGYEVLRTVVLYGGSQEEVDHIEVSLLLNSAGKIVLGIMAPEIFRESIKNLVDFWRAT